MTAPLIDVPTHRSMKRRLMTRQIDPSDAPGKPIVQPAERCGCQYMGPNRKGCKRKAKRGPYCKQHAALVYVPVTPRLR